MTLNDLPPRIPTSTVLKLSGYSRTLLWSRIRQGRMPKPIDRAKEDLYLRDEVLKHLGLSGVDQTRNPFEAALD
jgi:hypothetical protein